MRTLCWVLVMGWLVGFSCGTERVFSEGWTPRLAPVDMAAQPWMTVPAMQDSSVANSWLLFQREVEVAQRVPVATLYLAADTKYWLWVNDSLVVREGGLKWGPTPNGYYYDAVDVQPYLRRGRNRIALAVWYFGKQGFSHRSSGQAGVQIFSPDLPLHNGTDWATARHPAFAEKTAPPHPNWRLPESNIAFDARQLPGDLTADAPLFGYTGPWQPAVRISRRANRTARPRPIPQWKDFGRRAYTDTVRYAGAEGDTLSVGLPYNAQVTPYFDITAPSGLTIDIRTDNYRGGGPPNVRTEYTTRAGRQRFETPGWMNGHRVRYYFPTGITVHDLAYRETGYATDFTGRFSCDDPFFEKLWAKARRTLYVTMRDTYMDCPDRERAQWWGDVVLESGETFYALDRRSDHLTRKAIRELLDWQRPDSTVYSPIPAGNWDKELPTQMLASVGYYGVWNYYQHTGDRALLVEVYPAIKRYLGVWQTDADGLVIPREGGWTWGDWGENKDMPLIFNGWYYLALRGLAEMATTLGETADREWASTRMKRLQQAFNDRFWTGSAYQSPEHTGPPDDRGQALAVVAGIAPADRYPALRQILLEQRYASPYFEKYVLEALFQMGYAADALARMRDRFGPMVDSELSTLWEGWDIGSAKWGGGTYNHAWSGGGLTLLSQYVVGIAPVEPGYAVVRIRPQPGSLTRAAAVVDTPLGQLSVTVQRVGKDIRVDYEAPLGMEVRVEEE